MDVGRGWCPVKQCSATTTTMRDEVWCPIVEESGPDPRIGMKGKWLLRSDSTVLQVCVCQVLPCKDEIRFELFRLNLFATQSKKWNKDDA